MKIPPHLPISTHVFGSLMEWNCGTGQAGKYIVFFIGVHYVGRSTYCHLNQSCYLLRRYTLIVAAPMYFGPLSEQDCGTVQGRQAGRQAALLTSSKLVLVVPRLGMSVHYAWGPSGWYWLCGGGKKAHYRQHGQQQYSTNIALWSSN